jgi:hypothetical protein
MATWVQDRIESSKSSDSYSFHKEEEEANVGVEELGYVTLN